MSKTMAARRSDATLIGFTVVTALGFLLVPFLIAAAPREPTMGLVQKIFYFHVPCAFLLLVSTLACAGGSLGFLFKGSERADRFALACAELGVLFGACVMVSGPLWGRVAWGVYWAWDARLTSSLLLWLMMIAYLLARRYGGPGGRKLAAALALFAAADAPLVYVSVNVWRTIHPKTTVVRTLGAEMKPAFWTATLFFFLLWGVLLALRIRLEAARAALTQLEIAYEDSRET